MIEITDPREEEGAAHYDVFVAITRVPGVDGSGTSTSYFYPGDAGYDVIVAFLAMRAAAAEV